MFKFIERLQYGNGYLMAKGDHEAAMNAINNQRTAQTGQQDVLRNQFSNQYNNAYAADTGLRGQITSGYTNLMDPNNINDILTRSGLLNAAGGLGGGGVSGGIDPRLISGMGTEAYAGFKNFADNGGLSPEFRAAFDKSMGDLDTSIGSYKNFIDTGGFSDADISAMRAQGNAPNEGIYKQSQDDLATAANMAHGNIGNIGAVSALMAQNAAKQTSANAVSTEANLAQMKQSGKEFGTTGLAQASLAQAQARTAVQQLDDQMRMAGLQGMTDIEKSRLQAQLENAQINQSASASNASLSLARSNAVAGLLAGIPENALKGLTDLYGTAPAATGQAQNAQLALLGLSQGGNLGLINSQIGASNIPGNFSSAMGNLGSIFGAIGQGAGALMGGFGGGGGGLGGLFGGGGGGINRSSPGDIYGGGGLSPDQAQWPNIYGGGSPGDQGPYYGGPSTGGTGDPGSWGEP